MMNRLRISIILLPLMFAVIPSAQGPAAELQEPKTILDYYLSINESFFRCELNTAITKEYRLKQIKKRDIAKGYILSSSEGSRMEVRLFTDDYLGIRLLAVNIRGGQGSMCTHFSLLKYRGPDLWDDVSGDNFIFPSAEKIAQAGKGKLNDYYELEVPEAGDFLNVLDASGTRVLKLKWSGGQFSIE